VSLSEWSRWPELILGKGRHDEIVAIIETAAGQRLFPNTA
jgi:hypothetical protein